MTESNLACVCTAYGTSLITLMQSCLENTWGYVRSSEWLHTAHSLLLRAIHLTGNSNIVSKLPIDGTTEGEDAEETFCKEKKEIK